MAQSNFMAMVAATVQPMVDLQSIYAAVPGLYDVDVAVGEQLDVIGQWVGISRNVLIPLTGTYFAFDTVGVGFDQGIWQGAFDPTSGVVAVPDDFYRLMIKIKILNNQWDCDTPDAYSLLSAVFAPLGYTLLILDNCDLTMRLVLVGNSAPPAMLLALLNGGYFDIKPAGVWLLGYYYQPGPVFAFDIVTSVLAGFDQGNWAVWYNRGFTGPAFAFDLNTADLQGFDTSSWGNV